MQIAKGTYGLVIARFQVQYNQYLSALRAVKSVHVRNYSVRIRESADQNNSEYEHSLRSASFSYFADLLHNPLALDKWNDKKI